MLQGSEQLQILDASCKYQDPVVRHTHGGCCLLPHLCSFLLQYEREAALKDFSAGTVRVLIATDVASRGLDVKGIGHVINMDLPRAFEDYVHRIGECGSRPAAAAAAAEGSAVCNLSVRAYCTWLMPSTGHVLQCFSVAWLLADSALLDAGTPGAATWSTIIMLPGAAHCHNC